MADTFLDVNETRVHREIERKLEVPARFRLPALEAVDDGIGEVQSLPTLKLTAVYWDTDDLRLARHRITLRRRTGGHDDGWHLKLPHADESTRDEVQLPLGSAAEVPAELATLVLGVTRGRPLQAVATLVNERRPTLVHDADGAPLAEVTDDRVTVRNDGRVTARFRELEVEAAAGRTNEDLQPVVDALLAAGASPSSFASKAVRALGPRAVEPPDVVHPGPVASTDPAGAAVTALIATHVTAFLAQDLRLRRDLPDAVHQMRVAARRLRSGLKVFAPLVEQEWAQALTTEIAWFASQLSASRDREVLEARLLAGMESIEAPGAAKAIKIIRRELGHDEAAAFAQVREAMESPRYLALLDALVDAACEPVLTEAADVSVEEALPPLVRSAWKRLAKDVRKLRHKGADEPWHQARIRAKHARYAADALVPVFGKPAKRWSKQLERVTELLGRHQDAAIAAETAQALAATKGVGGKAGYALGLLHDLQRAEVKETRRLLVEVWPSVADPEWRRWLKPVS